MCRSIQSTLGVFLGAESCLVEVDGGISIKALQNISKLGVGLWIGSESGIRLYGLYRINTPLGWVLGGKAWGDFCLEFVPIGCSGGE